MNNVNGSYLSDQVVTSLCHCQKNTDSTASHTRYSPPRCPLLLTNLLHAVKNNPTLTCGG